MNEGKYIFTQVTSLVPRQIFQRLIKKYNGDYRVREFNCTNQLKYMLFGQLMPCDALRDICLCLGKYKKILYGFGMTTSVNESSLSRANESRDYRIYEGLGLALIKIVRPMYSKQRGEYIFPQDHELFALDSTTISCSIALMGWALGKYSKGAVRMHTLIDLRGSILVFISISDGRKHDSKVLDEIEIVVKVLYDSPYSISEIGTLVKVYGLVKMDLGQLVTAPQPLILNQDVNELSLF